MRSQRSAGGIFVAHQVRSYRNGVGADFCIAPVKGDKLNAETFPDEITKQRGEIFV